MNSLANNYRPLIFSDLIGQETLVRIITNSIKSGKIANSFLLTGPYGIGKTSTARIIAKSLNCENKISTEPCMNCSNCRDISKSVHADVLEMDAASNTGVDDIRAILEDAKYMPSQAKCKVYIIDEVHMLSNSAFNALLKVLEEPYDHVKFILATTEFDKVPSTIISRCQRFHLKRINDEKLTQYLQNIADKEGVTIAKNAASLISRSAKGSVRDGISILEQLILYSEDKNISIKDVQNVLGISDKTKITLMLKYIADQDAEKLLMLFHGLYTDGNDPIIILEQILGFFHVLSRIKIIPEQDNNLEEIAKKYSIELSNRLWQTLLNGIQNVKISPDIYSASEIILLRLCYLSSLPSPQEIIKKIESNSDEMEKKEVTEKTVLDLCKKNGEFILYQYLNTNLKINKISSNVITLELISNVNSLDQLKNKLLSLLNLKTNKEWKIEIIDKIGQYPVVNKIMQEFKNSKIVSIKKV
ncbi:MAG: DNA polymerase III subunit gamma/tau [Rickettsiaceae bacterium H1]|nr:DNA polymerase III subunit gamma/tau [Rickettsiaceae bacterium H1]